MEKLVVEKVIWKTNTAFNKQIKKTPYFHYTHSKRLLMNEKDGI